MSVRTLLAAGLCLAAGTALAEERGNVRTFRDWVVGCDNARTCRAFGLPARDSSTQLAVRIDRSGDPGAAPSVTVILAQDAAPAAGSRVRIAADGGGAVEVVIGRDATIEDGEVTLTDRAAAGRLINEIRRGRNLAITLDNAQAGGERADPVSLDGAMAALLWMDDRQKRIGTVTALARPGAAAAATMPRPPQAPAGQDGVPFDGPAVPTELPQAWTEPVMQAFRTIPGDACNQEDDNDEDIEAQRLSPQLVLVSVRCWRGAYNFSRAYYIVDDGPHPRVRPASFPRVRDPMPAAEDPPSNRSPDNILWNAELDPAGGTVFHVAKGRGMSDCGEIGEWRWDGSRFQPLRLEVMPTCRGLLPPNWITLFRTR